MVQEKFAGSLTYVQLAENLGGAGGFDKGMRLAYEHGHEWIWCLDSDALPSETTLEGLLSAGWDCAMPIVAKLIFRDPEGGELYPGGALRRFSQGKDPSFARSAWEGRIVSVETAILCCLLVRAGGCAASRIHQAGSFYLLR